MTTKTGLSVYCIINVSSPPISLNRRGETGAFYCHLGIPIQDQLVIFCEGDFDNIEEEFSVTLTYKDDVVELGKVTNTNRCLVWKRASCEVPKCMTDEAEKGVAKLLLEKMEIPLNVDTYKTTKVKSERDLKEENENTPQIADGTDGIPSKPQKKRRSSLNKEDKTPSGPSSKKPRTQSLTRMRTAKSENKSVGKNSPKAEEQEKTQNNKIKEKTSSDAIDTNVKSSKTQTSSTKNSTPKLEKTHKTASGSNDKKLAMLSKNEQNVSKDSEKQGNAKSGRRKSETKKKSELLEDSENKEKRTRKSNKASDTELNKGDQKKSSNVQQSILTDNSTDKENVHIDNNIPLPKNDMKEDGSEKTQIKKISSDTDLLSEKVATCKDLTLRALDRPSGRWGHSLCFVNKNLAVLIGGQGEKQQISKDSVWTLDCETRRWKDPPTEAEGQKPEYRMGHSATYDPLVRCIYVYGGSKNTRWFHDVHILDIEEWKWQIVKVNGKAPTRAYHSATLYRHELWIFGGVYPRPDPQPDGCSNEVHIFSPVMESWYSPIVSGEKPIPRSGHSATLINDQLVIFGGWDAPISYSDLHILDMSIVEWSQPKVTGSPPSPRSWHASCALSQNRLLIHGGYNGDFALEDTHIFNLDELSWCQIHVENQPCARVGHKALCMPYRHDNEEEDEVIIFGGGDNDGAYFGDLYSIYVPFRPALALK